MDRNIDNKNKPKLSPTTRKNIKTKTGPAPQLEEVFRYGNPEKKNAFGDKDIRAKVKKSSRSKFSIPKIKKKPKAGGKAPVKPVSTTPFKKASFLITLIVIIAISIVGIIYAKGMVASHREDEKRISSFKNATYSGKLMVNSKKVKLTHPYKVKDGITYMPVFDFVKMLGKEGTIEYGKDRDLTLRFDNNVYKFVLGEKDVVLPFEKNKKHTMKGTAEIIDSTLYLPMDFMMNIMKVNIHKTKEGVIYVDNYKEKFNYDWTKNKYIAHALGGINDDHYTNSLEALESNYKRGFKVFEADLTELDGDEFALIHTFNRDSLRDLELPSDWARRLPSVEEFKNHKIKGQYTPMTYSDLVKYMSNHKDMYLVIDVKISENTEDMKNTYEKIVKLTKRVDPEVLKRLIPQIYYQDMYESVLDVYHFKSMIFTMYRLQHFTEESITDFAYEKGIKVVASYRNRFTDEFTRKLKERGIMLYMFTYNDPQKANRLFERGVYGIYTDFLPGNKKGYGPN